MIVVMREGQLCRAGTLREVFDCPVGPFTARVNGGHNLPSGRGP